MATRNATINPAAIAGFFQDVRNQLIQIRNETMAAASDSMSDALQHGQEVAHERIELSVTPTGEDRAARGAGFPGRIDTGDYEDDFQIEHYQVDEDHMQGRAGWLDAGEEAHGAGGKSYIELQEDGFTVGVTEVAPVHALLDAMEVAKADFKKGLTDYVSGLN